MLARRMNYPWKIALFHFLLQSRQGDRLGGDASASGIYETVRSEVRRAISDIQNDLENVGSYEFLAV